MLRWIPYTSLFLPQRVEFLLHWQILYPSELNIEINSWRNQKKQEYHLLVRQSTRGHAEAGFHYNMVLLCRNKPLWEVEGNYGLSPLKYIYSFKVKILHTLFTESQGLCLGNLTPMCFINTVIASGFSTRTEKTRFVF